MDKEVRIGKEIIIFSNRIHRMLGKETAKFGLTGVQGRILGFVHHESKNRDVFQRDIEEELDIRRSSVTSVLQLMEKNGFIKRESVSEDARLKRIILTEKGLEIHFKVVDCIDKFEKSLRDELSEEELNIFLQLIHRLSEKIAD